MVGLSVRQAKYLREMLGEQWDTDLDRQAIEAMGPAFAADIARIRSALEDAMKRPIHPKVEFSTANRCHRCGGCGYSRYRVGINPFDLSELVTCRNCEGTGVDLNMFDVSDRQV